MIAVDCVTPGYAPFQGFDITENFGEYMKVFDELLAYDFDKFTGGHLTGSSPWPPAVWSQTFAGILWPHANKRSRGIAYPPVADVGSIKDRSASSELRPGRRAPRTFGGGYSTQLRK
jgi:hypothetical protein